MFKATVKLGEQEFAIESEDFAKLFDAVAHANELEWRLRPATNVKWRVRRVKQRKFYDLVGYISHQGEKYRCEMTLGQYEEEGRPLPFFLRANAKWKWYDRESEVTYEYHGKETGFIEVTD